MLASGIFLERTPRVADRSGMNVQPDISSARRAWRSTARLRRYRWGAGEREQVQIEASLGGCMDEIKSGCGVLTLGTEVHVCSVVRVLYIFSMGKMRRQAPPHLVGVQLMPPLAYGRDVVVDRQLPKGPSHRFSFRVMFSVVLSYMSPLQPTSPVPPAECRRRPEIRLFQGCWRVDFTEKPSFSFSFLTDCTRLSLRFISRSLALCAMLGTEPRP